jgi:hypothetical protein
MIARTRRFAAAFSVTVLLAAGALVPAAGAQVQQDGLVNVNIGDITIRDVNVGVAAFVAAIVCGVRVGPVAVLATQVDASGAMTTVCRQPFFGDITFSQN